MEDNAELVYKVFGENGSYDTGGNFATGVNDIGGKIAASNNDTGGKIATINDTGGKVFHIFPSVVWETMGTTNC
jgi:hypothetical protein